MRRPCLQLTSPLPVKQIASKRDAVSPVVAVLRTLLASVHVQETPKPTSRRVTKTRLLTSHEFINELVRKEEERKKQATEKGAAKKSKKSSAKEKKSATARKLKPKNGNKNATTKKKETSAGKKRKISN